MNVPPLKGVSSLLASAVLGVVVLEALWGKATQEEWELVLVLAMLSLSHPTEHGPSPGREQGPF